MNNEGYTPPQHLSEVEGNAEYREQSVEMMEKVANGDVSDESIADWLEASAKHLGSIASVWASRRLEDGNKFTGEGEKRGGAVMFSDGTVRDLKQGEFSDEELYKDSEQGIIVNKMLINLADKLRYTPEDMGKFEIGQLKRYLQFHEDIFRKENPDRDENSPLQQYINNWEQRRLELPNEVREKEIEAVLA